MSAIEYFPGQEIGSFGLKYKREVSRSISNERRATVTCQCGKEFIAVLSEIRRNNTKSCGCFRARKSFTDNFHRPRYKEGDIVGNNGIKYIARTEKTSSNLHIRALFECSCGVCFADRLRDVETGNVSSCGCARIAAQPSSPVGKTGERYICKLSRGTYRVSIMYNQKMIVCAECRTIDEAIDARDAYLLENDEMKNRRCYVNARNISKLCKLK